MPRPQKCRKICQMPKNRTFFPENEADPKDAIVLTVDEYEAIRLIDQQELSQEQAGTYMQVARTTVQIIYNSARKKLADALVNGLPLRIEGGRYQLCDGKEEYCACGGCRKHRRLCVQKMIKEKSLMKIAIPLDENKQDVCIVLARAPFFMFYENGESTIVENPAAQAQSGAGIQAAQFLVDHQINTLITVRCGQNSADIFQAADITIYKSVHKAATDDLAALEAGNLEILDHFHGGFHGTL